MRWKMKVNEKVTSMDRTFCIHKKCKYKRCDRHQCHMIEPWFYPVSYADFSCSEYCETAKLKELEGDKE